MQSGVKGAYGTSGATLAHLDDAGAEITRKIPTLEDVRLLRPKALQGAPELASMATPLVLGEQLCFATLEGKLVVTTADGTRLWSYPLGGPCHAAPVAAAGLVIVGCDDGKLYAFRAK